MGGTTTPTSKTFYDKTRQMDNDNQPIVVVGGGGSPQSRSSAPTGSSSNPVPTLNNGPSMASLTDYINRVSWSSVF